MLNDILIEANQKLTNAIGVHAFESGWLSTGADSYRKARVDFPNREGNPKMVTVDCFKGLECYSRRMSGGAGETREPVDSARDCSS
jgi:hypothetical protein